jgi:mRNA interferase RelE/StbE
LPNVDSLQGMKDIKAMKGFPGRYRIRLGNYRIGIAVQGDRVEMMRVLHQREFYQYFP